MSAEVMKRGALDMQVCVPADWSDEQIKNFADISNPSGTDGGWRIRRASDPALGGDPERQQCTARKTHVHVMLDA